MNAQTASESNHPTIKFIVASIFSSGQQKAARNRGGYQYCKQPWSIFFETQAVQVEIKAAFVHQIVVIAFFNDVTLFDDQDAVGIGDC